MATLQIGAPVEAVDGPVGRIDSLVVEPVNHSVEQLVVRSDPSGGDASRRLVPASHLLEAGPAGVRLDLAADQVLDCDRFERDHYREVGPGEWMLRGAELGDVVEPIPEEPADVGVATPDLTISKVEPARLLGNEVREQLRAAGFDDREINEWSRAYFAVYDEGDADDLIAWIGQQEGLDADRPRRGRGSAGSA